ncbi:hypothetical protein [Gudongella oleilytica]|uniref:hypothetical protein n=1 Tax=Gudongella oleilytica TaxID=1582259 RepID=UPI002A35E1FF|nr:hypothetical protein [Gudongella oleilytica]MDY0256221.1 hypothetical protein [Gudongella oleilytica]
MANAKKFAIYALRIVGVLWILICIAGASAVGYGFLIVAIPGLIPFFIKANPKVAKVKIDPVAQQRIAREKQIYSESVDIMRNTKSVQTFLQRYSDVERTARNIISLSGGFEQFDNVSLFCDLLPKVIEKEIQSAQALKTTKGRKDRLMKIINILEAFEREDEGRIDDVISAQEHRIFLILEEGVDWSKEKTPDISFTKEKIEKMIDEGAGKILNGRGGSL